MLRKGDRKENNDGTWEGKGKKRGVRRISANAAEYHRREDGEEADSSPNHLNNVSKPVGIAFNVQFY